MNNNSKLEKTQLYIVKHDVDGVEVKHAILADQIQDATKVSCALMEDEVGNNHKNYAKEGKYLKRVEIMLVIDARRIDYPS